MHTKALRRGTPMAQLKREDFDTAAKMRSQMWFIYPFFGILLSPMLAAAAMSLSSVSVIGNALRLRRATL